MRFAPGNHANTFDEPPTCDFAFDEAAVLVDTKLADPLVRLKVKQARLLTVELFPGVNVSIPIGEANVQSAPKPDANKSVETGGPWACLAAESRTANRCRNRASCTNRGKLKGAKHMRMWRNWQTR